MNKPSKKYLVSWAVTGAVIPVLLLLVGHFMPKPPEWNPFEEPKLSPVQQAAGVVATVLYPAIFVEGALSLAVTDSGGDSGAPVAGTIIFAISIVFNAALYTVLGLVIWNTAQSLLASFKRTSG